MIKAWWIFRKDLRIETRTVQTLSSMGLFALLVVLVFGLAFDAAAADLSPVFPGLLWLGFLFAGLFGLYRGVQIEAQAGGWQALLMTPVDGGAIFLGKTMVHWLMMLVMELAAGTVFFLVFHQAVPLQLSALAVLWVLPALGVSGAGTLVAAVETLTSLGPGVMPVLLFPLLTPLVIAAVQMTQTLLEGGNVLSTPWPGLLIAFDVLFVVVPALLFESVLSP